MCKIIKEQEIGIGIFCQINLKGQKIRFLLTNNHILNKDSLIFENQIKCELWDKGFTLVISQERRFFTNEELDYTAIEIFEYDGIEHFFQIQNEEISLNEKIGIIENLDDKIKIKTGQIKEINDLEIKHNINEDNLSLEFPIILLNQKLKVIGIHKVIKNDKININNILIKNIINNMKKNEIICEYENKNENLKHKLFNTKMQRNELKESLDLYLNNDKIDFCNNYTFKNRGKYNLKLIFNELYLIENLYFFDCSSLTSLNLSNFNTNIISDMNDMFSDCISLTNLNLSNINTNNVTYMKKMFYNCNSLTSLDLSNFNTKNVIDMRSMFSGCSSLTTLNLSNFDTNNVNYMNEMFFNCNSLTSINLSNFNTNNVINMNKMFYNCSSLTDLNLSNFNTNKVNDMNNMFSHCSSLTSLNISNLSTNNVTNMTSMFFECTKLQSLQISNFNTNNVEDMRNMFSNCFSLNSLDLSNFNTNKVKSMKNMFLKCSSLNDLNLANFYFKKDINCVGMLKDCNSLKKLNINNITCPDNDIIKKILDKIDKNCEIIKKN